MSLYGLCVIPEKSEKHSEQLSRYFSMSVATPYENSSYDRREPEQTVLLSILDNDNWRMYPFGP